MTPKESRSDGGWQPQAWHALSRVKRVPGGTADEQRLQRESQFVPEAPRLYRCSTAAGPMRRYQAFPFLDYTPPSRLSKGRSGGLS
jgi:hypothetical protein